MYQPSFSFFDLYKSSIVYISLSRSFMFITFAMSWLLLSSGFTSSPFSLSYALPSSPTSLPSFLPFFHSPCVNPLSSLSFSFLASRKRCLHLESMFLLLALFIKASHISLNKREKESSGVSTVILDFLLVVRKILWACSSDPFKRLNEQ